MIRIPFSKSFIANTVTSFNVLCGFMSLVFASQGDLRLASILIIAAASFDMFDGIVARLLGTSSRFGVELDSLSDVVSFGAAPSFLIYKAYMFQYTGIGILLSACLLVFGALRLARFNIQIDDINTKTDFKGLPIPIQAITISLFVISFYKDGIIIEPYGKFVIPLIILLSILMVTKIRYNALPKLRKKDYKQKIYLFGILLIALILAIVTNGEILFYIFLLVVLSGVMRNLYLFVLNIKDENGNGNH